MNAEHYDRSESRRLSGASPRDPEDRPAFRLAQLALLLAVAGEEDVDVTTVDRLGYLDFFSANPFLVVQGDSVREARERADLRLAGFTKRLISYASSGQRFVSRRRRLQHDLALLVGYGVAEVRSNGYGLTSRGQAIVAMLTSVYAEGYRVSARIILKRLGRMSDAQLRRAAEGWLDSNLLILDFLDDVKEMTVLESDDPPKKARVSDD